MLSPGTSSLWKFGNRWGGVLLPCRHRLTFPVSQPEDSGTCMHGEHLIKVRPHHPGVQVHPSQPGHGTVPMCSSWGRVVLSMGHICTLPQVTYREWGGGE